MNHIRIGRTSQILDPCAEIWRISIQCAQG